MNYNKTIGKYGETIAADYLINNGYEILDRNFQTRYGEVDIIGQKDDMIIFFEIKSRYTNSFGTPLESVTCHKKGKIISISSYYIYVNNLYKDIKPYYVKVFEPVLFESMEERMTHKAK